jgi:molybdate transport system regulatory protein
MSSLRVRLRVDFGDNSAVGPGKIALLERMRETGSLSQAARDLRMSYRRAWQLLDNLNHSFREPVVHTSIGGKNGGGTAVTPFGISLVTAYRELEQDIMEQATSKFATIRVRPGAKTGGRRPLSKRLVAARAKR